MIIVPGEILLDVFPDYRRIGGAPFNFAYHLHRFGLPVRFVSRVGRDADGEYIRGRLNKLNFDDCHIQTDDVYPTGRVNVIMQEDGSHGFEILPDAAYDHIVLDDVFADAPKNDAGHPRKQTRTSGLGPAGSRMAATDADADIDAGSESLVDLIYFGTLAQRTPGGFSRMREFLARRPPSATTFCDINLRPVPYPEGVIRSSLEQADILKLNDQELDYLNDLLGQRHRQTGAFASWLMDNFGIKWIALTLGEKGSRIYTRQAIYKTADVTPRRIVDTVGAGDAYAAVLAIGYLCQWPIEKILSAASRFAADICGISGAVAEESEFYRLIHNEIFDFHAGKSP